MSKSLKPLMPFGVAEFIVMVHNDPNVGHLSEKAQRKAAVLYRLAKRTVEAACPDCTTLEEGGRTARR